MLKNLLFFRRKIWIDEAFGCEHCRFSQLVFPVGREEQHAVVLIVFLLGSRGPQTFHGKISVLGSRLAFAEPLDSSRVDKMQPDWPWHIKFSAIDLDISFGPR